MNTLLLKIVTLPDGSDVEVSETPLEWWTKPNKSGFVRTNMLAPDPKQPRRHINSERLKELHKKYSVMWCSRNNNGYALESCTVGDD